MVTRWRLLHLGFIPSRSASLRAFRRCLPRPQMALPNNEVYAAPERLRGLGSGGARGHMETRGDAGFGG